jgi:hypothetical protein
VGMVMEPSHAWTGWACAGGGHEKSRIAATKGQNRRAARIGLDKRDLP